MATALLRAAESRANDISSLVGELTQAKRQIERLLRKAEAALPNKLPRDRRPDRMNHVKEVMAITGNLRMPNGNLSAVRIAKLYGVSLSLLAGWLGRSRQAVAKTPDADSLQQPLSCFEQVARLTAVVSVEEFRKWLRSPNSSLDGKTPLQLMISSGRQAVADLADDMLTGSPD